MDVLHTNECPRCGGDEDKCDCIYRMLGPNAHKNPPGQLKFCEQCGITLVSVAESVKWCPTCGTVHKILGHLHDAYRPALVSRVNTLPMTLGVDSMWQLKRDICKREEDVGIDQPSKTEHSH